MINLSYEIRKLSAVIISAAKSSHIGGVFSMADILAVLYGKVLPKDESSIFEPFILSKGHCCAGVYAALYAVGLLTEEDLLTFGKNNSPLMAHISHKVPHVDFSTGSLGHGLPFAIGKAIARRNQLIHQNVYCLLSDGELNEGSNWEALMFAGHHQLDNLTAIIDYNKLQSLATTYETLDLEPLIPKIEAFRWNCIVCNGHSISELEDAFSMPSNGKPKAIICNTIKGYPISFMMNRVEWHYKSPTQEQLLLVMSELESFYR